MSIYSGYYGVSHVRDVLITTREAREFIGWAEALLEHAADAHRVDPREHLPEEIEALTAVVAALKAYCESLDKALHQIAGLI